VVAHQISKKKFIEGRLAVNLTTIWTDGKAEVGIVTVQK
jgi:hypothetical protein